MAKFNPILMQKVAENQKQESEQEKLKEETGIDDQDIVLKKRGVLDYTIAFLHCILYVIFVSLIFIGLITVLNPASRQVIADWISQFF